MTQDTVIFWFRRDLRLSDNEALLKAAEEGHILPVYILDERQEFKTGGASRWWLHHALQTLNEAMGGKLVFCKGDATKLIPEMAKAAGAKTVYWNKCYEPAFLESDKAIVSKLEKEKIVPKQFDGTMLWPVGAIVKQDGTPFKIYKPFFTSRPAGRKPARTKGKAGTSYLFYGRSRRRFAIKRAGAAAQNSLG